MYCKRAGRPGTAILPPSHILHIFSSELLTKANPFKFRIKILNLWLYIRLTAAKYFSYFRNSLFPWNHPQYIILDIVNKKIKVLSKDARTKEKIIRKIIFILLKMIILI